MKNESKLVKEYRVVKTVRRAGFVPAEYQHDYEVETWQVWCKNVGTSEDRRATHGDLRAAGFKKRKKQ